MHVSLFGILLEGILLPTVSYRSRSSNRFFFPAIFFDPSPYNGVYQIVFKTANNCRRTAPFLLVRLLPIRLHTYMYDAPRYATSGQRGRFYVRRARTAKFILRAAFHVRRFVEQELAILRIFIAWRCVLFNDFQSYEEGRITEDRYGQS